MLKHVIFKERWFAWTLVFLFVAGVALVSYIQWVSLEFDTNSSLLLTSI